MRKLIWLSSTMMMILFVSSVFAHHPFATDFDVNKPVTVTGTVTKLEWANPHANVYVDGRDSTGQTAQWVIELGNPGELTRSGWKQDSIKVGEMLTIEGWLAKDGSKRVNAKNVKLPGGATISAASSFYAGESAPTSTSGQLPQ